MLAYIWNKHHVFPGDVYNKEEGEKLFIYAATSLALEAEEKEREKMEREAKKGKRKGGK